MGTFGFAEWDKPEDAEDVVKVRKQMIKDVKSCALTLNGCIHH
jgi:hypothetical protein